MADRRTPSTSLSASVIEYLRKKGYSQAQIAKMLHVSEGFVSLVKSRERSLTIDHLELLSAALSVPLGAMLLAVTTPAKMDKEARRLFALSTQVMSKCDEARQAILNEPGRRSRRTA